MKGRAPMTGYDRGRFGPAWLDADHNGCDTRNDVLARDLTRRRVEPNGCVVTAGDLADRYTRTRIRFVKGNGDLVDIDHVVALGNAWVTGAYAWGITKRAALANDPYNLLAVDAGANRSKGDGDAATWLPGSKPFRCGYVARQVGVKAKYGLWVTPAEKAVIERILARCPGQKVPVDRAGQPVRVDHDIHDPAAAADPAACAPGYRPCLPRVDDLDCGEIADAKKPIRVTGDDPYRLDDDGDGRGCLP